MNVSPQLYPYLARFVNDKRLQMIENKIIHRTRYFSLLLENVYQSKNISAVLRTAECMGVQDIHIVENSNSFEYNPYVTRGADKWLTIKRYNTGKDNTREAIQMLKSSGYRIIATSPHAQGVTPENLDLTRGKFVIALGTEWEGLSDVLLQEADELLRIPMVGYTESLNLSVSAGILLYTLTNRLRQYPKTLWGLNENHLEEVRLQWIQSMVKRPQLLIDNFNKLNSPDCPEGK